MSGGTTSAAAIGGEMCATTEDRNTAALQMHAGLLPQPSAGGIVYVQASSSAACMQQAWMAPSFQHAVSEPKPRPGPSELPLATASVALANATIAIAPPPPAYLVAPMAKPFMPNEGRGRGRGRGSRGGGGPGSRGGGRGRSSAAPRTSCLQAPAASMAATTVTQGLPQTSAQELTGAVATESSPLPTAQAMAYQESQGAPSAASVTAAGEMENGSYDESRQVGSKTSARALLAQHKVKIPDDLTKLQPIPTRRTKSGWVGVYPARKGRWQAQVNHRSIGGYSTAWEAGVAVAAHLVVMARAEEEAERVRADGPGVTTSAGIVEGLDSSADTTVEEGDAADALPLAVATVSTAAFDGDCLQDEGERVDIASTIGTGARMEHARLAPTSGQIPEAMAASEEDVPTSSATLRSTMTAGAEQTEGAAQDGPASKRQRADTIST